MNLIGVKAQTVVQVELADVLQSWIDNFLQKLPLAELIEELTIDPQSGQPTATWNLGTDEEPSMHAGTVDVSCKDVVLYSLITNLLEVCQMPNSDKKFMSELGSADLGDKSDEGQTSSNF